MAEKGQCIRLVDVFILGPYMMNYAEEYDLLWFSGLLTIAYNGWNFAINAGVKLPELPL